MQHTHKLKLNYKDAFLPSLTLILATALVFAGFYAVKSVSGRLICQITDVAGEETDPTLGRLICCLIFFSLSILLAILAVRRWKAVPDKMLLTWTMSVLGGTLLWTSEGECSWHFGLKVLNDEGISTFASFPRLESIQGLPVFVLGVLLFIACHRKMSFPLSAYLLVFIGNWYGHLCMIAAYPVAMLIRSDLNLESFYKASALINAIIIAAVGLKLIFGNTKRTTKYLAAVCIYVALGNLLFGCALGET